MCNCKSKPDYHREDCLEFDVYGRVKDPLFNKIKCLPRDIQDQLLKDNKRFNEYFNSPIAQSIKSKTYKSISPQQLMTDMTFFKDMNDLYKEFLKKVESANIDCRKAGK